MTHEPAVAATRLAARLLFGSESNAPDPDPAALDEDAFLQVIVGNKVPFALVDPAIVERLVPAGWERTRELAARERDRLTISAREYARIAEVWGDRGIRAVLIKSPGYFPYTSDNVDVLVADRDAQPARVALEELGYRELPWVREPFKILLRKVGGDPAGFAIHLHTRVAWINSFFEAPEILETSRPFGHDERLWLPGPERGFLITTAHWFYEDKELRLRDLYHSREILRGEVDWAGVAAAASQGGWDEGLRSAVHLLGDAAADLGLDAIASLLPEMPLPTSRWSPRFSSGTPVAALPARIDRRKAKVMHFDKSLRNPQVSLGGRAREAALVFGYALKVRFPALQRAPLFVVGIASESDRPDALSALRDAAATLRRRFSLPVEIHEDTPRFTRMLATGGIHILVQANTIRTRPDLLVHADGESVRLEAPRTGATKALNGPGPTLATAIARAYLESIA